MKNIPRKVFLKNSLTATALVGLTNSLTACNKVNTDLSPSFVHHVFFWLKEPDNLTAMETCRKELKKLVTIESIRFHHIGVPADTSREVIDNTYQFSLLVIFDNKEGHDIYQEHAKHKEFIDECRDLWERVLVYDSWNN